MPDTINVVKKLAFVPCPNCEKKMYHDILLRDHDNTESKENNISVNRMIVQCRGCLAKSFSQVTAFFDDAYLSEVDEVWEIPEHVVSFPKITDVKSSISSFYNVPRIVRIIYMEALLAVKEDTAILAGLGLRATLEAICNDQDVKGKNLELKITKLQTEGLISKKDSERLHGIRFMGNDAAHDIKTHTKEQISVAVKIVDHLINTLYILENEVEGKLDTTISEYTEFQKLLITRLTNFSRGEEIPLAKILESDVRRFQGRLPDMEAKLKEEIVSKRLTLIELGKIDFYMNSPEKKQHYIVGDLPPIRPKGAASTWAGASKAVSGEQTTQKAATIPADT